MVKKTKSTSLQKSLGVEVCTGMETAGIQRNPRVWVWMLREYRRDGSDNCGILAGMDFITGEPCIEPFT